MEGTWLALPTVIITLAVLTGLIAIAGLIEGVYVAIREGIAAKRKAGIPPQVKMAEVTRR